MKKYQLLICLLCYFPVAFSQSVTINEDVSLPDPSISLDIKSLNKELLIPRMSSPERSAIPPPAKV